MKSKNMMMVGLMVVSLALVTGCTSSRGTTGAGRIGNSFRTVGDGVKMMFKGENTVDVANNGTRRVLSEDGKTVLVAMSPDGRMEGEAPFVVPDGSPTSYYVPENGVLKQVPQRGNAFQLPIWSVNVNNTTWYRGIVSKQAYVVTRTTASPVSATQSPTTDALAQSR